MLAGSPGDGQVTGLLAWGELRVGVASVESRDLVWCVWTRCEPRSSHPHCSSRSLDGVE